MSGDDWINVFTPIVADAYNFWSAVAEYGYDEAYNPYDKVEALSNSIGWASRNQNEKIGFST